MKKAAEILSRLLERTQGAGARPSGSLFGDWQEIVGVSLAEHCRAYDVRHHSLLVEADHPGWMQLLLLAKRTILGKIRQRFPQLEIRDLRVRVAASGPAARDSPPPPPAAGIADAEGAAGAESVTASPKASPEVEQAVAAVTDSGLKEKLRQLLAEIERRSAPKPQG